MRGCVEARVGGTSYETKKEKREKKRNIDSPTALLKITCGRREEQSTKGKSPPRKIVTPWAGEY